MMDKMKRNKLLHWPNFQFEIDFEIEISQFSEI
jgi:hypothetical protein